jgi:hypothetical protein
VHLREPLEVDERLGRLTAAEIVVGETEVRLAVRILGSRARACSINDRPWLSSPVWSLATPRR